MPGRHEKQRVKKKRSKKREALQPMEKLVKDSWVNRQNKETTILNELLPVERVEVKLVNSSRVGAAPATKKNDVVSSVATTRKNLSEENWMSKNRYATKALEKEFKNFIKKETGGKVDPDSLSNRQMKLMKAKYIRHQKQNESNNDENNKTTSSSTKKVEGAKASQQKAKTSAEKLLEGLAGN